MVEIMVDVERIRIRVENGHTAHTHTGMEY